MVLMNYGWSTYRIRVSLCVYSIECGIINQNEFEIICSARHELKACFPLSNEICNGFAMTHSIRR